MSTKLEKPWKRFTYIVYNSEMLNKDGSGEFNSTKET